MLDFFHILDNPRADIQRFWGASAGGTNDWVTWRKPRGKNWVYMLAVGGGASGGCGINSATTSGGGAGGGPGGMTAALFPAQFVPDLCYIQCGIGGKPIIPLISGTVNIAGTASFVCWEPSSASALNVIVRGAGGASGSAAATGSTGGTSTTITSNVIGNQPLAGRAISSIYPSAGGFAGGTSITAGTNLSVPTTGLFCTGGAGGGGSPTSATGAAGGGIAAIGLGQNVIPTLSGGAGANGATPAGRGSDGTWSLSYPFGYFFGGCGGGGASGTTAAGVAGAGGNGAPGCGGGGAGGSNTTATTLARPGDGGDGFVWIVSW